MDSCAARAAGRKRPKCFRTASAVVQAGLVTAWLQGNRRSWKERRICRGFSKLDKSKDALWKRKGDMREKQAGRQQPSSSNGWWRLYFGKSRGKQQLFRASQNRLRRLRNFPPQTDLTFFQKSYDTFLIKITHARSRTFQLHLVRCCDVLNVSSLTFCPLRFVLYVLHSAFR